MWFLSGFVSVPQMIADRKKIAASCNSNSATRTARTTPNRKNAACVIRARGVWIAPSSSVNPANANPRSCEAP